MIYHVSSRLSSPARRLRPWRPEGAGAGLGKALWRIVARHKGDVFLGGLNTLLGAGMRCFENQPTGIADRREALCGIGPVDAPRLLQQPIFVLEMDLTDAA